MASLQPGGRFKHPEKGWVTVQRATRSERMSFTPGKNSTFTNVTGLELMVRRDGWKRNERVFIIDPIPEELLRGE